MYDEDKAFLRSLRNWLIGIVITLTIVGGASTVVSRAFDLAWFPWEIKMKTQMIRASNSYVTTQQAALRQLRNGYDDAPTDRQRLGLIRQMREIADTIPNDVQPDIRSFLASH